VRSGKSQEVVLSVRGSEMTDLWKSNRPAPLGMTGTLRTEHGPASYAEAMPTVVHGFDWPDRVLVGTIGGPGSRAFYLQVREGRRVVSVLLEKQQAALLSEKIEQLLDGLMTTDSPVAIPAEAPPELVDSAPLEPVDEQFRAGTLGLGWDPSRAQIVLQAYSDQPLSDDDADEEQPAEIVAVRMPVGTARAFVQSTRAVVQAGRPLCPRCGHPMDPDGHVCEQPGLV
jgi:uncharacterized repeat protein (TIGR03847 family)